MPPIQIPARVTRVMQFTRFTQFPLSCSSRGDILVPHDSCEGYGHDVLQPVRTSKGEPREPREPRDKVYVTFFHRCSLFDAFRPIPR